MARSLHNQGDAQKDVLQGFVPGRYIGFLISINIVNDTDLLITSDLFNQDKWQAWLNHCKKVLGPQDTRSHEPGSTPFEQYSDGSHIKPVAYNTRCYQTGFTYEKPTLLLSSNLLRISAHLFGAPLPCPSPCPLPGVFSLCPMDHLTVRTLWYFSRYFSHFFSSQKCFAL